MKYLKYFEGKKVNFPKYKKFEKDGFTIYVGSDGSSNDFLSTSPDGNQLSLNGDDYWLHAMGVPGSHVIVKCQTSNYTQEKTLPTEELLRYAASLAKKNSKAPKDLACDVRCCKRKYVFKKPGFNIGQVDVTQNVKDDTTTIIKNVI